MEILLQKWYRSLFFEEREISYVTTEKELLSAVWDPVKKRTQDPGGK